MNLEKETNKMGASPKNNEPTLGKSSWLPRPPRTTGDKEKGPTPAPKPEPTPDRSFAQPLPGKEVREVKEKAEASEEDKSDALTENSQMGVDYATETETKAEAEVQWTGEPEVEEDKPVSLVEQTESAAAEAAPVKDLTDEDLDGLDPDLAEDEANL
jgi:hypothetical protein